MPLVIVGSLKGAPGATSTAAHLSALWTQECVLVECDPAGGDLAAAWRLAARPSLVEVAAGDGADEDALDQGIQRTRYLGSRVDVVCAPSASRQAVPAISRLAEEDVKTLTPAQRWVFADCGRLATQLPTWPLLAKSDAIVLVIDGTLAGMLILRGLLTQLPEGTMSKLAIVVVPSDYSSADVNSQLLSADVAVRVLGDAPPRAGVGRKTKKRLSQWRKLVDEIATHASPTPLEASEVGNDDSGEDQ